MSQGKNYLKWILSLFLLVITTVGFSWFYYQRTSPVKSTKENKLADGKAEKILKEADESLKNLKEFSFQSVGYFEVVNAAGNKEKMDNSGQAYVKRPNKIMIQRTGEKSDLEFYCDGKKVTLYGKKNKFYASAPAAANLDQTFDRIRDRLDIELPATDLLYSDMYDGLMQDVVSGKYMGKEKVGNTNCDHIAFTGKEVDWEMWVQDGSKRLPMKYLIISKNIEGKPKASIEIKEWKTDLMLDDKMFTFVPPKGSRQIEFLPLQDTQTQSKNK